ncbi:polyhydroxyalkanoic acid system family protein [Methylobacterium sp. GC_Met_3]|uniref:polyhydroxyalkanoic acid system family protein n=1 Tax=Methylobacterium sp. GC_Met_3 TaxID=2937375 RepID=UPI00226AA660|nr:polyhydroxyalkanoic acid system family protein [Methylobacterium sp. GC_Met_3]
MPRHITIAAPHNFGTTEVRRRLDEQLDWALQRLRKKHIAVEVAEWSQDGRAFTVRALGQHVSGNFAVADDSLWFEAQMPWIIGVFAPAIEAVAIRYAARLLSAEGDTWCESGHPDQDRRVQVCDCAG